MYHDNTKYDQFADGDILAPGWGLNPVQLSENRLPHSAPSPRDTVKLSASANLTAGSKNKKHWEMKLKKSSHTKECV